MLESVKSGLLDNFSSVTLIAFFWNSFVRKNFTHKFISENRELSYRVYLFIYVIDARLIHTTLNAFGNWMYLQNLDCVHKSQRIVFRSVQCAAFTFIFIKMMLAFIIQSTVDILQTLFRVRGWVSQSSPRTLNHMEDGEQNTGRVEKRDGVSLLLPLFLPSFAIYLPSVRGIAIVFFALATKFSIK